MLFIDLIQLIIWVYFKHAFVWEIYCVAHSSLSKRRTCNPLLSLLFPLIFVFSSLLCSSLLSVKNLVDLYGKDELIYLGPDEQVIDKMCDTIRISTIEFYCSSDIIYTPWYPAVFTSNIAIYHIMYFTLDIQVPSSSPPYLITIPSHLFLSSLLSCA